MPLLVFFYRCQTDALLCGREKKKAEVLTEKRKEGAPPVVALLPLSQDVDVQELWNLVLTVFAPAASVAKQSPVLSSEPMEEDPFTGQPLSARLCQAHQCSL